MLTLPLVALLFAASPDLEEGRLAVARLKYAQAVTALRRVADDGKAPTADRVEALDLIARSQLALGDAGAAKAAYDALLGLDPMAADPAGSPKIRAAFKSAKEARFAPRYLALTRRPSTPDLLEADVVNPWRLTVVVEVWEASTGDFVRRDLPLDARVALALSPGTRCYLRAVGTDGVVLATLGSPNQPIAGPLPPPPPPPPLVVKADEPKPKTVVDVPKAEPKLTLPPPVSTPPQVTTETGWTTRKTLGLSGILTGVALLATGIVLAVLGTQEVAANSGINAPCFPFCTGGAQAAGETKQSVGAVLGLLGVALAGGGTYLMLSDGHEFGARSRP